MLESEYATSEHRRCGELDCLYDAHSAANFSGAGQIVRMFSTVILRRWSFAEEFSVPLGPGGPLIPEDLGKSR